MIFIKALSLGTVTGFMSALGPTTDKTPLEPESHLQPFNLIITKQVQ